MVELVVGGQRAHARVVFFLPCSSAGFNLISPLPSVLHVSPEPSHGRPREVRANKVSNRSLSRGCAEGSLGSNVTPCSCRSSMKRMYQDQEQSCSPPSKQARREDPQRGKNTRWNTAAHELTAGNPLVELLYLLPSSLAVRADRCRGGVRRAHAQLADAVGPSRGREYRSGKIPVPCSGMLFFIR